MTITKDVLWLRIKNKIANVSQMSVNQMIIFFCKGLYFVKKTFSMFENKQLKNKHQKK